MKKFFISIFVLLLFFLHVCCSSPSFGVIDGHEYVNLGLSVKWATCNIGANVPEEYGDFYSWGEVSIKSSNAHADYKWYKDGNFMQKMKYCFDSDLGTVDNKISLDEEDDAAIMNWGKSWRMPTYEEQEELMNGCTWEWTTDYNGSGVAGRIGTSKKNGNKIFLPAGGHRYWSDDRGGSGFYWSSSMNPERDSPYSLQFNEDIMTMWDSSGPFWGMSVRPVVK